MKVMVVSTPVRLKLSLPATALKLTMVPNPLVENGVITFAPINKLAKTPASPPTNTSCDSKLLNCVPFSTYA